MLAHRHEPASACPPGPPGLESGDLPTALSLAEMRLQSTPADSDALQLKAFALRARGDLAGAEAVMRQAHCRQPEVAMGAQRPDRTAACRRAKEDRRNRGAPGPCRPPG
ncbi:MAG: hypothetical protein WDN06_00310 [Asticcacaulis sp.]